MSKQTGYSWLSPYLLVNNVPATIQFYQKAFGFDKKMAEPNLDGNISHAELTYKGQTIMIGSPVGDSCKEQKPPISSGSKCPISMFIYVEDVDKFYTDAVVAGAKSIQAPEDMHWGDRMCSLEDIDGYCWHFATHSGNIDLATAQA